jgi:hypothetical protein
VTIRSLGEATHFILLSLLFVLLELLDLLDDDLVPLLILGLAHRLGPGERERGPSESEVETSDSWVEFVAWLATAVKTPNAGRHPEGRPY